MKRLLFISLFVLVLVGCCSGTYFLTKHLTFANAYSTGKDMGYKQGYKRGNTIGYKNGTNDQKNKKVYQPYDFDAYNSGYSAGVASVPTSTSTHCTSMTYGIESQFTSTNCN